MPDLEIFRTTVTRRAAAALLRQLRAALPPGRVTFDLTDCDRVLRVHTPGHRIDCHFIISLLRASGHECAPLPD